ncbi:MAG: hypothetical protein BWY74_00929 [Firmicutes bacterium ADurb.Bin419]|nr:MAG: hypothetical protein BWY74_00929 [Firmicutes bacterium ADurb.Bin419]
MKNNVDNLVKDALHDEVKEISNTENIFKRIEANIMNESGKRNNDHKYYSSGFGSKKIISLAACLLLVLCTLTFITSNQARALAYRAISAVKTIFVVENDDGNLQIVEKPSDETSFVPSISTVTDKSDEEISAKVGYNVSFPETLNDSFELVFKNISVSLLKAVDYETGQNLQNDLLNAIEDDNALNQFKQYGGAIRNCSGTYSKPDRSTLFVNILKSKKLSEFKNNNTNEIQEVKVGKMNGLWEKSSYPEYPYITEDGVGKEDMTSEPIIKESYTLYWEKDGTVYTITTMDYNLTLDEAVKIALEFMEYN